MLLKYIKRAQEIKPILSKDLHAYICQAYVEKRRLSRRFENVMVEFETSPRFILSLIRTSLALSRARLDTVCTRNDVQAAIRLFESCSQSLIQARPYRRNNKYSNIDKVKNKKCIIMYFQMIYLDLQIHN